MDAGTGVYKRPESVLVVVYTAGGDVLLLKRVVPADFWQSVTGSLGSSETPETAARRELLEETGIEGNPEETGRVRQFEILPEWSSHFAPGTTHNREHEYRLELPRRVSVCINSAEHATFEWLPCADAVDRVSSWSNRSALVLLAAEKGWTV